VAAFQVFDGYIYVDFWKKGYYSIIRVRSIGGFGWVVILSR